MKRKEPQGFLYIDLIISILIIGIWISLISGVWSGLLQKYQTLQKEDIAIQRLIYYGEQISSQEFNAADLINKNIVEDDMIIKISPKEESVKGIKLININLSAYYRNKKIYEIFVFKKH